MSTPHPPFPADRLAPARRRDRTGQQRNTVALNAPAVRTTAATVAGVLIAAVGLLSAVDRHDRSLGLPSAPSATAEPEVAEMDVATVDVATVDVGADRVPAPIPLDPPAPSTTSPGTTPLRPLHVAFERHPGPPAPECDGGYTSAEIATAFDQVATGIVGADYARAQILADGRVLWVFQDVFLGDRSDTLWSASFVHNAGLVQDGSCFFVLHGGGGRSWIGGDLEQELRNWYWPLDSVVGGADRIVQFMVEMRNPNNTGAAEGAEPVAVWMATIDTVDLSVVDFAPAPDPGDRPLYGFSITSDDEFHYLYGNCYRQFADHAWPGHHDAECGPLVYVARVPIGDIDALPEYWNGTRWSADRAAAAPISANGQFANPMQVRRVGDVFLSVAKLDDWWPGGLVVQASLLPTGPFVTIASAEPAPLCDACTTYFAHLLPWSVGDHRLLVMLSNNAWHMVRDAFPHPERYRPTLLVISLPELAATDADDLVTLL